MKLGPDGRSGNYAEGDSPSEASVRDRRLPVVAALSPADRQRWILDWLRERPRECVDVLDAEFVDAYIDHTGAKYLMQFFGAPKCPQLGRDLGALYGQRQLRRVAVGLPAGYAAMGFPKWIYCYRL